MASQVLLKSLPPPQHQTTKPCFLVLVVFLVIDFRDELSDNHPNFITSFPQPRFPYKQYGQPLDENLTVPGILPPPPRGKNKKPRFGISGPFFLFSHQYDVSIPPSTPNSLPRCSPTGSKLLFFLTALPFFSKSTSPFFPLSLQKRRRAQGVLRFCQNSRPSPAWPGFYRIFSLFEVLSIFGFLLHKATFAPPPPLSIRTTRHRR